MIQMAYDNLATVAVFLEQAILDEVTYEVHYKSSLHSDLQHLLQHYIVSMMCSLQVTMYTHNAVLELRITRDVMASHIRFLPDRSLRHVRDYVVLQSAHAILDDIHELFVTLRKSWKVRFIFVKSKTLSNWDKSDVHVRIRKPIGIVTFAFISVQIQIHVRLTCFVNVR